MDKIVKKYKFYNCDVLVLEEPYRDRITGEIAGDAFSYTIIYPGDVEISSWDKVWYSQNDCLEAALEDICDGDISMVREMKLRMILEDEL